MWYTLGMGGSGQRLLLIDALRGAAALAVLFGHVYQQFLPGRFGPVVHIEAQWLGTWGVSLFFVLSGFCIHLPHARRIRAAPSARIDSPSFLRNRFLRIAPAYWAALALSLLVGAVIQTNTLDGSHSAADVALHALCLHTLWPSTFYSINGVFWTIGVEVHFYLIYLLFADRRLGLPMLTLLILVGLGIYGAVSVLAPAGWREPLQHLALTSFWQWYFGAWLAQVYAAGPPRISRGLAAAAAIPLLAVSFGLAFADHTIAGLHFIYWILPVVCGGIVLLFASAPQGRPNVLSAIGVASYSLYLLHPVAIGLVVIAAASLELEPLAAAALALIASLGLATVGYRWVELPAMEFRRRFSAQVHKSA